MGASRFTALLAAVTITGVIATFWWALKTRSEMQASTAGHSVLHRLPTSRLPGWPFQSHDDTSKIANGHFDSTGASDRVPSGRQLTSPQVAPRQGGLLGLSQAMQNQGPEHSSPSSAVTNTYTTSGVATASSDAGSRISTASRGADMPLPAMPSEPDLTAAQLPKVVTTIPLTPSPPTAVVARPPEHPGRIEKGHGAKGVKYYNEEYVEQGIHQIRKRACEPPDMPDVCFMPFSERQKIVVTRP